MSTKSPLPTTLDPNMLQELKLILQEAERGNEAFLPALRTALERHPEIATYYGDLSQQVQESWKNVIAGPNLVMHEAIGRKVDDMRAELSGTDPTALEKLLIERILACWLQTEHADAQIAQTTSASPAQHTMLQKRLTASQHRYLASIRQLGTIRKLLRPALSPLQLVTATVSEGPSRRTRAPVVSRRLEAALTG